MNTMKNLSKTPGVKYKAVLSNRIYLTRTKELHDYLIKKLTYVLPPKRPGHPNEYYCDVTRINDNVLTIPIGRTDLIPEFYSIEDKRLTVDVDFPKFKFELRESQREVVDNLTDSCLINANPSYGKTFTAIAIACKLKQKTLVVVHTSNLRKQWIEEVRKTLGIEPGEIGGGKNDNSGPIVIATIQTLKNRIPEVIGTYGTVIVDECLDYKTRVDTLEYGYETIGKIVNQKLAVHVKSWNGKFFEYKKVLNYFKNKHTEEFIKYSFSDSTSLRCTLNHTLYIYKNGKVDKDIAGNIVENDWVITDKKHKSSNHVQHNKDIILGCIIGDGSLQHTINDHTVRVYITQGEAQKGYLEYKRSILNNICGTTNLVKGKSGYKKGNSIYSFSSLTFSDVDNWHEKLYHGESRKQYISKEMSELLTLESWSLMYQDDGSMQATLCNFHIYMDEISTNYLIDSLNKLFNVKAYYNTVEKNGNLLRIIVLNTVDSEKFINKIAHLIHPDLSYKKGKFGKGIKFVGIDPVGEFANYAITKVIDIDFCKPTNNHRYNIEVEDNHNYIANGILVSNCHHIVASVFKTIVDATRARYKIGLSATLWRKDGKHVMFHDYTGAGLFTPKDENKIESEIIIVNSGITFSTDASKPWQVRVNELMQDPDYMNLVVNLSKAQAARGHKVLTVGNRTEFLENCGSYVDDFQVITGSTSQAVVDLDTYNGIFGTGSIFSEGVNHPSLSSLIMAYPINNRALLKQLIGRIERIHEGKMIPEAIDISLEGRTAKMQLSQRLNFYTEEGYKLRYI